MIFSSMFFLWLFLPVVFCGNFLLCKYGRRFGRSFANVFLLFASLLFYAWGEPVYVFLMLFSILLNWIGGLLLQKNRMKRLILSLLVISNISILGYFKYAGMLVHLWNYLTNADYADPDIKLPVGISFFTFQAISYIVDVYRNDCNAQKNPFKLALYISFFPQLIAGPIVKYRDIEEQIDQRELSLTQVTLGIKRFVYGLAKKVLIANALGLCTDQIYALEIAGINGIMAVTASLCYTLQIYYDFSGYSDMAIGLGKMFGFDFKENFNYPYVSESVREFWRRWHISLGSWFKEYVYIPLGGSRQGTRLTYENLLIVFFLTGLWHGAGLNFIFWGLFHGCFMILEKKLYGDCLRRHPIISWIYTFVVVSVGWIFFRITTLNDAFLIVKRVLVPWIYQNNQYSVFEFMSPLTMFSLIVAMIGIGFSEKVPLIQKFRKKFINSWIEMGYLVILMVLCLGSIAGGTYNPFIYFRF